MQKIIKFIVTFRSIKRRENLERCTIFKCAAATEVAANGNRAKRWKTARKS